MNFGAFEMTSVCVSVAIRRSKERCPRMQLMTSGMFNDTIIEVLVHCFNGRPLSALGRLVGVGKTARLGGPAVDDEELTC